MRHIIGLIAMFIVVDASACGPAISTPRLQADCQEQGTIGHDRVPAPTQGFEISFDYYLPPCYHEQDTARYPTIYLITMPHEARLDETANTPMSLADRLIRDRRLGPVILIVPDDTAAFGYHAALAVDLVPYVDSKFKTLPDRRFRGVGGISHGAAIAARMAFQYPEEFGSLGVFSGGIPESERARFDGWIASADVHPRVLIDVGDSDAIFSLTQNLTAVLDQRQVDYSLSRGNGGHNWNYWSTRMESGLLWFAESWK